MFNNKIFMIIDINYKHFLKLNSFFYDVLLIQIYLYKYIHIYEIGRKTDTNLNACHTVSCCFLHF